MNLSQIQIDTLEKLMRNSANKGNQANSAIVLEHDETIAEAESLVVTNKDATAHSERVLVAQVCRDKGSNSTPGLTMVTVVEPCLMCLSACTWAGYTKIAYIIPADRYVKKIPWVSDTKDLDKSELVKKFTSKIELIHLKELEERFCKIFESEMEWLLK